MRYGMTIATKKLWWGMRLDVIILLVGDEVWWGIGLDHCHPLRAPHMVAQTITVNNFYVTQPYHIHIKNTLSNRGSDLYTP